MDEVNLYIVEFIGEDHKKRTMAIYDADSVEECKKTFYKYESNKSIIKRIKSVSEYEYKHMV